MAAGSGERPTGSPAPAGLAVWVEGRQWPVTHICPFLWLLPVPFGSMLLQEVPDPIQFFVTRWSSDPWIQMAYSFVKTGGSGEAYDIIAEEIQGMVYFAGEVRSSPPGLPLGQVQPCRFLSQGCLLAGRALEHGGPI